MEHPDSAHHHHDDSAHNDDDAAHLALLVARRTRRRLLARNARARFVLSSSQNQAPFPKPPPPPPPPSHGLARVAFVLFRSDAFWAAAANPRHRTHTALRPLRVLLGASHCLRAELLEDLSQNINTPPKKPFPKQPLLIPASILSRALTLLIPFDPTNPSHHALTAQQAAVAAARTLNLPAPIFHERVRVVRAIVDGVLPPSDDGTPHPLILLPPVNPHALALAPLKELPFLDALRLLVVPTLVPRVDGVDGLPRVAAARARLAAKIAKAAAQAKVDARADSAAAHDLLDAAALAMRPYRFSRKPAHTDTTRALYAADDALSKLFRALFATTAAAHLTHLQPHDHTRPLSAARSLLKTRIRAFRKAYAASRALVPALPALSP
jgi:hypothetical protein